MTVQHRVQPSSVSPCTWGSASGGPVCGRPARAAVRTTRPSRPDVRVMVYTDDRVAPRTAQRYCHEHTAQIVSDLVRVLVDVDESEATP